MECFNALELIAIVVEMVTQTKKNLAF